ncbi:MAG: hypothetical protein IKD04_01855 [Clostridia bacterium]|nr:hypothetical protein [Clostridia bacterium]
MKNLLKKSACFLIAFACVISVTSATVGAVSDDGRRFVQSNGVTDAYTYSKISGGTRVVSSPDAYLPYYVVDSDSLGAELVNPSHIATADNKLYIVNTGKNNIIVTDEKFGVLNVINSFDNNGTADTFAAPEGCFVDNSGKLYIADTENHRIVILDKSYRLIQIIDAPKSDVLAADFVFKPQKIVVDSSNRIFVVSDGVYEGIMQFYGDGSFIGFVGSIPVTASPIEILWKKLLSKEQTSKLTQFVPVSYTNIFLDSEEFMYTVSLSSTLSEPIRRLNPGGADVLIRNALAGTDVSGDQIGKDSQFVAVCADESNTYYAADSVRSRIFIYDEDGNLLCVMGGSYTGQIGTYKYISSMLLFGGDLLVVDSQASAITALYPTEYMLAIKEGLRTYRTGLYEESYQSWQEALSHNSNFDLAYSKIGMIEIRKKNYGQAMEYFKLANDQKNYSKAYVKYRSEWYTQNLSYVITAVSAVVVLIVIFKFFRKKRVKK